jgi:hypothetical protein
VVGIECRKGIGDPPPIRVDPIHPETPQK